MEELSNSNLSPIPYSFDKSKGLTDKVAKVVNKLMIEYNQQVIKIFIEQEQEEIFRKGIETGKNMPKTK